MDAVFQRDGVATTDTTKQSRKPTVVFVGSFEPAARDGTVGGQMFACRTLAGSALSNRIDWVLIDSTQKSLPVPPLTRRVWFAFLRILRFTRAIAVPVKCALIFTSYVPWSLAEKGLMCWIARLRGTRVVLSLRSEVTIPDGSLKRKLVRGILRSAHVVLCQTEVAANNLQRIFEPSKVNVVIVPNWIDCSRYAVRRTSPDAATFLFLGWCEWSKGVKELMQAASLLAREEIPFRLHVAGGGSALSWIRKTREEFGLEAEVSVHGWVNDTDKTSLLKSADVLILPSYTEGLPNAILEGMASGLAVIATPVGGIPTLVTNGDNGLLVPPGDAISLAAAMRALAGDLTRAHSMGYRNADKVRRLHDVSKVIPIFAKVLELEYQRV